MGNTGVFIGIGSNLGDRLSRCQSAVLQLRKVTTVCHTSSLYETEPMENTQQGWFYNAVVEVATALSPRQMLMHCREIEKGCGRERTTPKGPRTLDLDILFWGQEIIQEADLMVPHPAAHQRRFVLIPLLEIAPEFIHPQFQAPLKTLLDRLSTQMGVKERFGPDWPDFVIRHPAPAVSAVSAVSAEPAEPVAPALSA